MEEITVMQIKPYLQRAETLIEKGSEAELRYACLELRFALELMTYKKGQKYLEQLPYEVVRKWQPQKLLKAISQIDELCECSGRIRISEVEDREKIFLEGQFNSFSCRELNKIYNKLGSFLHSKSLEQMFKRKSPKQDLKSILEKVLSQIEKVVFTTIQDPVVFDGVSFLCEAGCGISTKCSISNLHQKKELRCVNPACQAVHTLFKNDSGNYCWRLRVIPWVCPSCESKNTSEFHVNSFPAKYICPSCSHEFIMDYGLNIWTKDEWYDLTAQGIIKRSS